jgi:hypothetical protein
MLKELTPAKPSTNSRLTGPKFVKVFYNDYNKLAIEWYSILNEVY